MFQHGPRARSSLYLLMYTLTCMYMYKYIVRVYVYEYLMKPQVMTNRQTSKLWIASGEQLYIRMDGWSVGGGDGVVREGGRTGPGRGSITLMHCATPWERVSPPHPHHHHTTSPHRYSSPALLLLLLLLVVVVLLLINIAFLAWCRDAGAGRSDVHLPHAVHPFGTVVLPYTLKK